MSAPEVLPGQLSIDHFLDPELEKAREVVQANRPLFEAFVRLAGRLVANGRDHYSARSLLEILRWETAVGDLSAEFRINNNFSRPFALVAMADGAVPREFFATRDRKGVQP